MKFKLMYLDIIIAENGGEYVLVNFEASTSIHVVLSFQVKRICFKAVRQGNMSALARVLVSFICSKNTMRFRA
jgi:hypothetical protein